MGSELEGEAVGTPLKRQSQRSDEDECGGRVEGDRAEGSTPRVTEWQVRKRSASVRGA